MVASCQFVGLVAGRLGALGVGEYLRMGLRVTNVKCTNQMY